MSKYGLFGVVFVILIALVAVVVRSVPAGSEPKRASNSRAAAALQFYHLKNLYTNNNPLGAWKMEKLGSQGCDYVFKDTNGQVIDSIKDPKGVLEKVVDVKNNPPVLTGEDIVPNAQAINDSAEGNVISIKFTAVGSRKFNEFTRNNIDEYLAVFFEGKLITAPCIKTAITGGKAQISGFASMEEAKQAAEILN